MLTTRVRNNNLPNRYFFPLKFFSKVKCRLRLSTFLYKSTYVYVVIYKSKIFDFTV